MLTKTRGSERFVFRSHPKNTPKLGVLETHTGRLPGTETPGGWFVQVGQTLLSKRVCQALGTVRTADPAPWSAAMGPHTPAGLCAFLSTAFRRLRILGHHEGPVVPGSPRQSDFGLQFLRK